MTDPMTPEDRALVETMEKSINSHIASFKVGSTTPLEDHDPLVSVRRSTLVLAASRIEALSDEGFEEARRPEHCAGDTELGPQVRPFEETLSVGKVMAEHFKIGPASGTHDGSSLKTSSQVGSSPARDLSPGIGAGLEGLDLAELEKAAREAGPEEWNVDPASGVDLVWDGRQPVAQGLSDRFRAVAAHIATFDPPTVLKLIAAARQSSPAQMPDASSRDGEKTAFKDGWKAETLAEVIYSWRPKVIYDRSLEPPEGPHRPVTWAELNTHGAFGWEPGWADTCRRRARSILALLASSPSPSPDSSARKGDAGVRESGLLTKKAVDAACRAFQANTLNNKWPGQLPITRAIQAAIHHAQKAALSPPQVEGEGHDR